MGVPKKDEQRSGSKPKRRFKEQLRVLVLDLYVAWVTDPTLSIGVQMSLTEWKVDSRYNALHLSTIIPPLVHKLHDLGMIELSKGSYSGPGHKGNRTTRIIAAKPLIALFEGYSFPLLELEPPREQKLIILRNSENKNIDYEDTPKTNIQRGLLRAYNELLWSSFIDLPEHDAPFIERAIKEGVSAGQVQRVAVGGNNYVVRRVFSRESWEMNGRFYGGWWQMMPKEIRNQIHINDHPTVEIDFKGLHVTMLSKEQGIPLTDDPYSLAEPPFPLDVEDQRAAMKQLVLTAINAKTPKEAFAAFRNGYSAGDSEIHLTNKQLQKAVDLFTEEHPHLKASLFADEGIRLMGKDSLVAKAVIARMMHHEIPVLCIHDSFIVDARHQEVLQSKMNEVTSQHLGAPFKTSTTTGRRCHDPTYDGNEPHPAQQIRSEVYFGSAGVLEK